MSKRVIAAAVKSAVNNAAIAQVTAAGFIATHSFTSFSGKTAYAVWKADVSWDYSLRRQAHKRRFRINYPAMPDDAVLTRNEADLIAAVTLHETGHVIYTNNDELALRNAYPNRAKLHTLANGFEDGRMESSVIQANISRNAKNLFQRLLNKLTSDIPPQWNPCNIANSPFAIAMIARDALGNGNRCTAKLLDRIPEPYRAIYAAAYEWCAAAPMGFDADLWSYRMAQNFMQLWAQMRETNPLNPKEEQEEPPIDINPAPKKDDGWDYNDDGEDEPDAPDEEFEEDLDQPSPPPPADSDPDDEFGQASPSEEDEDESEGEDGDSDEEGEDGEPGDGEDGDPSDGDEGDGEGDGEPQSNSEDGFSPTGDAGPMQSPEPNIDELFKRINKRAGKESGRTTLPPFYPADRGSDVMDMLGYLHLKELP